MIQTTTVRLPSDLLKRAKQKAAADGRTLTALIEDGLRIVVRNDPGAAVVPRRMPRVSTSHGTAPAGLSIERLREIEEEDDLEYAERLRNGFR